MQTKQQMQTSLKDFLFEAVKNPNSKIAPLIQTILVHDSPSTETEVSIEELKIIQANIKNEKEESEHLINTLLANCAVWGIGYTLDEKTLAFNLCQKACEQNYPLAHYVMARCLAWSLGCKKDVTAAIKHYKLAAKAGIVSAQRELGLIYEKSKIKELEKDPVKAAKLYEIADKQSIVIESTIKTKFISGFEKLFPVGFNPIEMQLSEEIRNAFRDFLTIAKKNPNIHKDIIYSINTILRGNPDTAVVQTAVNEIKSIHKKFKDEKKSHFLINTLLAYCAQTGVGFKENESKLAYMLCKKACDKNHPMAQFVMAEYLFSTEKDVKADKTDKEKALEYYANASNNGVSSAQVVMAKFYLKGYSNLIKKDLNRAAALLTLAAEQKNSLACYYLAKLYENGTGVKSINLYKALKYYKLSANYGFREAKHCVGKCHEFGLGTDINFAIAERYTNEAIFEGYTRAKIAYLHLDKKWKAQRERLNFIEEEITKARESVVKLFAEGEIDTYDKFLKLTNSLEKSPVLSRLFNNIDWINEINRAPSWACDNLANIMFVLARTKIDDNFVKTYVEIKGEDNLIKCIKKQNDQFLEVTGQYLLFSAVYNYAPNLLRYLLQDRRITPAPMSYDFSHSNPLFFNLLEKKEMEELSNMLMEQEIKIYSDTNSTYPRVFNIIRRNSSNRERGLKELSIILKKGANPLLGHYPTINEFAPFVTAVLEYYTSGWAVNILAEYGGGLLTMKARAEDYGRTRVFTGKEAQFQNPGICLAARKQSNPEEITWVYSAKKFGELLTGPTEDAMLPQASLIYQHIKDVIPGCDEDIVEPEVREAIREQQKRGRLIFSTLKNHLQMDLAKECMSFAFITPLAEDCIQTVLPTKFK